MSALNKGLIHGRARRRFQFRTGAASASRNISGQFRTVNSGSARHVPLGAVLSPPFRANLYYQSASNSNVLLPDLRRPPQLRVYRN